ncbi:hypothetical protein TNCT_679341 [Trichonephila clavata]|uniref:Uncharacterized protein n=1 Tax=Trichonephila clavata TaxID=2740835 RepID=A0A8X6KQL3_TRICU|nr:hypothetical protein TNCT_679341 [Trichonephila clavata]
MVTFAYCSNQERERHGCAIPPHIPRYNSLETALGRRCIQRVEQVRTTSEVCDEKSIRSCSAVFDAPAHKDRKHKTIADCSYR